MHITGAAGLLCDATSAGLIRFKDAFARLSQTRFRLSTQVVAILRQLHPSGPTKES